MNPDPKWRVSKTKDDREILSKIFFVKNLSQALEIAKIVVAIAVQFDEDKDRTHLSLASTDVQVIILHDFSQDPIDDDIYKLAEAIDKALAAASETH